MSLRLRINCLRFIVISQARRKEKLRLSKDKSSRSDEQNAWPMLDARV
jgi:hypothetical protein